MIPLLRTIDEHVSSQDYYDHLTASKGEFSFPIAVDHMSDDDFRMMGVPHHTQYEVPLKIYSSDVEIAKNLLGHELSKKYLCDRSLNLQFTEIEIASLVLDIPMVLIEALKLLHNCTMWTLIELEDDIDDATRVKSQETANFLVSNIIKAYMKPDIDRRAAVNAAMLKEVRNRYVSWIHNRDKSIVRGRDDLDPRKVFYRVPLLEDNIFSLMMFDTPVYISGRNATYLSDEKMKLDAKLSGLETRCRNTMHQSFNSVVDAFFDMGRILTRTPSSSAYAKAYLKAIFAGESYSSYGPMSSGSDYDISRHIDHAILKLKSCQGNHGKERLAAMRYFLENPNRANKIHSFFAHMSEAVLGEGEVAGLDIQ